MRNNFTNLVREGDAGSRQRHLSHADQYARRTPSLTDRHLLTVRLLPSHHAPHLVSEAKLATEQSSGERPEEQIHIQPLPLRVPIEKVREEEDEGGDGAEEPCPTAKISVAHDNPISQRSWSRLQYHNITKLYS